MTKILSKVSHKNYNLNANEGFVMFLTSKLITSYIYNSLQEWNLSQFLI